jgi:uncharacterized protein YciI
MPYFMMKLVPPRPTFLKDATATELEAMGRHAAYVRALIEQGKILAAGPVDEPAGAWGFGLARAADAAEAAGWGNEDPVVQAGLGFRWEVYPIVSLLLPQG